MHVLAWGSKTQPSLSTHSLLYFTTTGTLLALINPCNKAIWEWETLRNARCNHIEIIHESWIYNHTSLSQCNHNVWSILDVQTPFSSTSYLNLSAKPQTNSTVQSNMTIKHLASCEAVWSWNSWNTLPFMKTSDKGLACKLVQTTHFLLDLLLILFPHRSTGFQLVLKCFWQNGFFWKDIILSYPWGTSNVNGNSHALKWPLSKLLNSECRHHLTWHHQGGVGRRGNEGFLWPSSPHR